jgi:hypothetical protein
LSFISVTFPNLRITLSFVIVIEQVAPLEIHKENLADVEEQLLFLLHVIKGIKINVSLPILKGSFTSWIWSNLGIMVGIYISNFYAHMCMPSAFSFKQTRGKRL